MLPQNHFLISAIVIVPVALVFFPSLTLASLLVWILCGGLLSAAVDLDIVVLTFLKSKEEDRLKPFRNPLEINRNFDLFMDTIYEVGVLKTALTTHFLVVAFILLSFYLSSSLYFVPVALGVVSHLISDIPNYRRVLEK